MEMRMVKKAIFYVGAIFLMGWLMSLNQAICNLVGAFMLIFIMRMAIPILALNYKLRNANKKIEISVIPSKSRLRNRMWFAALSSGLILISFNDQVFVLYLSTENPATQAFNNQPPKCINIQRDVYDLTSRLDMEPLWV
jgi:hypothetical protein